MKRLRRWLSVACYAGCIAALTACGDDDSSGTDAGETMIDGSMRDGGSDASMPDPCAGRALCDAEGTSCDGDTLVTCAEDADGCLVATRTGCGVTDQVCEESGGEAACVDACASIPEAMRCTTDGERSCDGDTLEVCAPNADGCLVLTETNCAEADGGTCDPNGGASGDMPVCVMPVDPCAGVDETDRCDTAGTSCEGDTHVACAPNAMGCLVRTTTDCATRTDGTCEVTDGAAECTAPDACAGITQCAAEGATCEGPVLVACAPDAFGCLVETRTDCTDTAFGFCDADASPAPQCSTAATDPCLGVTQCGTEPSRVCSDADTLTTCAPNEFGCFVATDTDCAPEICDASGEMPVCVDPCSLVDTCAAPTQCDGDVLVTCEADTNGCLVETSRTTCEDACGLSGGSPACIDPLCPTVEPLILDCDSGTVTGNTAGGSTVFGGSTNPCIGAAYAGPERAYRFRNPSGPVDVRIVSTRLGSSGDFDLFAIRSDGTNQCNSESLTCADSGLGSSSTETVEFFSGPEDTHYIVYDVYTSPAPTTEFTLAVTCTPIVCGDGTIHASEQCDDGNTDDGDGCSSSCQLEAGFDCTTGAPTTCTRIVCGDGIIGSTEACDDGNTDDLDGCSSTCEREDGWVCAEAPSVCRELAPNHLCAGATPVAPAEPFTAPQTLTKTGEDLTLGGPRPTGTNCSGTGDNRALYYAVTIPAMSWVDVVPTRGTASDLVITAQDACSPTGCLSNVDSPERLRLDNLTTAPITRIVSIHNWTTSGAGTYDVAFTFTRFADNAICDGATPVTSATGALSGENLAVGSRRPTGTSCGPGEHAALYYAVEVGPNQSVDIEVTPDDSSHRLAIVTEAACGAAACDQRATNPLTARLANPTDATVTHIVSVYAQNASDVGAFEISFTYRTIATNASCASGTAITGNRFVSGERLTLGGPAPAGTGCGTTAGRSALYYDVTIPANGAVDIEVTPDPTDNPNLYLLVQDGCEATACDVRVTATPLTTRLRNASDAPVTRSVAVHSRGAADDQGIYDIDFRYSALASNAWCGAATELEPGDDATGENLAFGGPRPTGTSCASGTPGDHALYYSVTISPYSELTVTATPESGGVTIVSLDSCEATACTQRDNTSPYEVRLPNATAAPITQIVAVYNSSSSTTPTFAVTTSERAFQCGDGRIEGAEQCDDENENDGDGCSSTCTLEPGFVCTGATSVCRAVAPNAFCAGATEITGTDSATDESAALGGPRPADTTCSRGGSGGENHTLYYSLEIPPLTRVAVSALGTTDLVLLTMDSCDAAVCTAGIDGEGASRPEVTSFRNDSPTETITRIVAVRPYSASTGTWDVDFTYHPYVCGDGAVEGIEACDDGNDADGDGCSSTCTLETNFVCTGSPSVCRATAPNAFCAGATEITGTDSATDESAAFGGPRPPDTTCSKGLSSGQNHTLYYSVEIPPLTRVAVSALGTTDLVLLTMDSCDAAVCTAGIDGGGASTPEVTSFRNDSPTETITRIVAVRPFSASTGTWDVDFTYHPYVCGDGAVEGIEACDDGNDADGDGCSATCTPESGFACVGSPSVCVDNAPANAYCAGATVVTADDVFTDESTAVGGPRPTGTNCGSGAGDRALYYAVTIPAGQQVVAEASNVTGNVVVFSQSDCAATACLGFGDGPDRVALTNLTDTEVTRIVGVRSSGSTPSTYDISFAYSDYTGVALPATIPDGNQTGIEVVTRMTDCPTVAAITMDIDIDHLYRGDLRVRLTGPAGVTRTLWNQSGGSDDHLIGKFNTTLAASGTGAVPISEFVGEPGTGSWVLNVADVGGGVTGTMRSWSLNITCAP